MEGEEEDKSGSSAVVGVRDGVKERRRGGGGLVGTEQNWIELRTNSSSIYFLSFFCSRDQ